jgi:hypothetical protein
MTTKNQPAPKPSGLPDVWPLVIADMQARDAAGRRKYGVPLQPHNGRDALQDLYEELLDAAVYIKQAMLERGKPLPDPLAGVTMFRDAYGNIYATHENGRVMRRFAIVPWDWNYPDFSATAAEYRRKYPQDIELTSTQARAVHAQTPLPAWWLKS